MKKFINLVKKNQTKKGNKKANAKIIVNVTDNKGAFVTIKNNNKIVNDFLYYFELDSLIDILTYELNFKNSEDFILSKMFLKDFLLNKGFIYF